MKSSLDAVPRTVTLLGAKEGGERGLENHMHKRADRFLTLPKTGEGSIKGKDGSNVSLRL